MKNIRIYHPKKYNDKKYQKVEENIYKVQSEMMANAVYVTSLCFEQEPELGEGSSPQEISQYPLEDILDEYMLLVEDFFEEENKNSVTDCYVEFSGLDVESIRDLLGIVGKHVYNQEVKQDGERYMVLVIE